MTDPTGANTVRPLSLSVSCTEPGEVMAIGPADGRGERGGAALCGAAIPIGALPAESAPPQLQTTDATAAATERSLLYSAMPMKRKQLACDNGWIVKNRCLDCCSI